MTTDHCTPPTEVAAFMEHAGGPITIHAVSNAPYRHDDRSTEETLPVRKATWWGKFTCWRHGCITTLDVIERWLQRKPARCPRCGVFRNSPLCGTWGKDELVHLHSVIEKLVDEVNNHKVWVNIVDDSMKKLVKATAAARERQEALARAESE